MLDSTDRVCSGGDDRADNWCFFPEGGGEEIEIDAELHDQRSDGEVDLYLLGIEIPELPPGRYRLELEAADPATGKTVRTTGLFSIR